MNLNKTYNQKILITPRKMIIDKYSISNNPPEITPVTGMSYIDY